MRRLIYFIFASVAVLVFVQCSDWTEMENKFTEPVNINSEDYYRALREYKKTDHPICFGWYSDWSGTGDNMNNQLRGIPDSMDLVSLWGGAFNLTEAQKSDLKEVLLHGALAAHKGSLCAYSQVPLRYPAKTVWDHLTCAGSQ